MEYMELGSLHDLLHNETMVLDAELIMPILCDVSQGVRFLHAAQPPVIHGDLKSANGKLDMGNLRSIASSLANASAALALFATVLIGKFQGWRITLCTHIKD